MYGGTAPVFLYVGGAMIDDPHSGWWVVALTEMVVKTASFILQEAYDQYRLCVARDLSDR